jgi:hypothetical protein
MSYRHSLGILKGKIEKITLQMLMGLQMLIIGLAMVEITEMLLPPFDKCKWKQNVARLSGVWSHF